jgi:hypothetical protein
VKQIFLIAGKAQNGKDSTADILIKHLNGKSKRLALADYLKLICKNYFEWSGEKDDKGRSILQFVGTDLIRDKLGWQEFHVERICEDIKIAENEFDYFLVPDVRRKNEIYYTQAMFPDKVTTIRVERLKFKSPLTKEQQKHISETDLDNFKFDYYIKSESGLDNLEGEILRVILNKENKNYEMQKFFREYC